ncbi:hypothetical protein E2C01_020619 [Portunus trituberculatus]|uniref:Uncharacterized protein n=1 Tax=Portunus trituberculatus TaxID=210409 RepID=A0A5B7E217_PORTR|nr:hypothetical protein [Portunus trituberculatus]
MTSRATGSKRKASLARSSDRQTQSNMAAAPATARCRYGHFKTFTISVHQATADVFDGMPAPPRHYAPKRSVDQQGTNTARPTLSHLPYAFSHIQK